MPEPDRYWAYCDEAWKHVLERFFPERLQFFLPALAHDVDFTTPITFLDKERKQAVGYREKGKRGVGDMKDQPSLLMLRVVRQILHEREVRFDCIVEPSVRCPEFTATQFGKRRVQCVVNPWLVGPTRDSASTGHHIRVRHQLDAKSRKPRQRLVNVNNSHPLRVQAFLQDALGLVSKQGWSNQRVTILQRVE